MNCATRSYGFDQDSNRTSLTTYGPGSGGACSTTAPASTINSTYDQADRLTNTGYAYDTLGRTTLVPAVDASGIGQYATNTGNLSVGNCSNDLVQSEAKYLTHAKEGHYGSGVVGSWRHHRRRRR